MLADITADTCFGTAAKVAAAVQAFFAGLMERAEEVKHCCRTILQTLACPDMRTASQSPSRFWSFDVAVTLAPSRDGARASRADSSAGRLRATPSCVPGCANRSLGACLSKGSTAAGRIGIMGA
jgi:hypothetical protein